MANPEQYILNSDYLFKLLLIGDSGVGKSSLLLRFSDNTYTDSFIATIGVDFLAKAVTINETPASLQIWDTAGQERFKSLGAAFYRGSDCCILVYDITSSRSFESLDGFKQEFITNADVNNPEKFPIILLGNKCDHETDRQISEAAALNWCQNNGNIPYFETSAKDSIKIKEAFITAASKALEFSQLND